MTHHKLVIAEKPSVAQSIAAVLGATKRNDGYLSGNGYLVSWCFGHLAELAGADVYDEKYAKWRYGDLPILPANWRFTLKADKAKQFELLRDLMRREDVTEVINACVCVLENPDATLSDLMQHVTGPDFPTKGIIMGRSGIRAAYATGRGKIILRARTEFEEFGRDRTRIIVTELPYQVNKRMLIKNMADQVNDKRLEGISDIRDESDRNGMRMVIELKRDANPQVVLNRLFNQSQLQTTFAINMLALVQSGGQPHQGEDQCVKAGDGRGEQQIAEHPGGQGVHRSGGGTLKGGGDGGDQGIEEGDDVPKGEPLEHGGLDNGPDQPCQGIEDPFDNGVAAGQHGASFLRTTRKRGDQLTISKDLMTQTSVRLSRSAAGVSTA